MTRFALVVLLAFAQETPPPAPVVFNHSQSARPGDLASLQGENFGAAPEIWLGETKLPIVNSVGTGWVAVRIPADAKGDLTVRIKNGGATSAPVSLNRPRPIHLDCLQIAPGGRFRIFGRNLVPTVTVNGKVCGVKESDEHQLTCIAPVGLEAAPRATVAVDGVELDRPIEIVAAEPADPFKLGVGWTAAFAPLAERVIVPEDGKIQAAIDQAAAAGGGTVRLPEGTLSVTKPITLRSRVILEGAGKEKTILRYEKSNYPIWASGFDLIALRNLTLQHAGDVEGPLIKGNTRVVLQNVRFDLQVSQQMYLSHNRNIVVSGCDFLQRGTIRGQGPYQFSSSAGLVFVGNRTEWAYGAPSFQGSHDSALERNTWTRDASVQNTPVVTTHSCVIDFCHRIAVVGNTLDVSNGPVVNRERNDGETLLTEGGGGLRTENLGSVATATATTLTDPANTLNVDPFGEKSIPENYGVAIVDGRGAGQTRRVTAYAEKTLTVDRAWEVIPNATSRYATFVWGLEKSILKGNTLKGNPRGIWLYHCAIRDVDVVGNSLLEGGGIFLRTWQSVADKQFTPHYNVRIAGNTISNTTGVWASHIGSVYVLKESKPFGIGQIGIEIRDNRLTANEKNLQLNLEDYASLEGYYQLLKPEGVKYEGGTYPAFLGTIYERNWAGKCDAAFRLGPGAAGTTLSANQTVDCKSAVDDAGSHATVLK